MHFSAQSFASLTSEKVWPREEDAKGGVELIPEGRGSEIEGPKTICQFFPNGSVAQVTRSLSQSANIEQAVENSLSPTSRQTIDDILQQVSNLNTVERLLLYLKLPTGKIPKDPLKLPSNPLGSRPEISQTISWIKTHLKEDKETSLPKQDVYDEYLLYCEENGMKPLSTADFGKVMKQVYPEVRPRRLGTRGNSRYCYAGMTKRTELPSPFLPSIPPPSSPEDDAEFEVVVCSWASRVLGSKFSSLSALGHHLVNNNIASPTNTTPTSGNAFVMSAKIAKQIENCGNQKKGTIDVENKRKMEDDSGSNTKTPPERCKGKKGGTGTTGKGKKSKTPDAKVGFSPSTEMKKVKVEDSTSEGEKRLLKLPIPRLQKSKSDCVLTISGLPKKQKPLQPKPGKSDFEFLENGNSLEQEEELLKYFQSESRKISEEDGPKMSQLRMLLEKKTEDKFLTTTRRRVSFENPESIPQSPVSQKKFSFVPISPISNASGSPFLPPKVKMYSSPQRILHRSNSVNSPLIVKKEIKKKVETPILHNILQQTPVGREEVIDTEGYFRSQSVPMVTSCSVQVPVVIPETPVSSEISDFNESDSNFVMMDDSSSSLLIDTDMNQDNLSQIFNIIDMEMSKQPRSYPNTPISYTKCDPIVGAFAPKHPLTEPSKSYPNTPVCADQTNLFQTSLVSANGAKRNINPLLENTPLSLFEEDLNLDCEDPFNNLAREVNIDTEVI